MGKTEHIGLHQWAGTDQFLREDFNEDHRKIDAAVGRTEAKADRALAGLVGVSYNVYNSMLRDHYEGKYTGFKRALAFDGFQDGAGLAALSAGAWLEEGKLRFCRDAAKLPLEFNYGSAAPYFLSANRKHTRSWDNPGHGKITGGSLYLRNNFESYHIEVALSCGGSRSSKVISLSADSAVRLVAFELDKPLILLPGHTVEMTITSLEEAVYEITLYGGQAGDAFGCRLTGTETAVDSGKCLTIPYELGQSYTGAVAWVRYEGAPPALAVKTASGARCALELAGTRSAAALDGTACMEAEYRLDAAPPAPNSTATVELDLDQDGIGAVYDYGIVFQ